MQILPELMAALVMIRIPKKGVKQLPVLTDFDARLFESALCIMESVLRMGLSRTSPTYNPSLLRNHLATIHALVDLKRG